MNPNEEPDCPMMDGRRKLHAAGDALLVKAEMMEVQRDDAVISPQNIGSGKRHRHLGKNGRQCGTLHIHVEDKDEQRVEHHVHQRTDTGDERRGQGVALPRFMIALKM